MMFIFFSIKADFKLTVKSNYAIATAAPCDWLKILAPVFQRERSKTKTHRTLCLQFAPRFEEVMGNCYEFWLIHRTFGFVVIGWSELLFWYLFFDSNLKAALINN